MRTTMEDFVQSYFPYAGLDPVQDVFKFLDVLVWVEATIYQMDEDNEAMARQGDCQTGLRLLGDSVLPVVLGKLGLMSDQIHREIQQGDQYWEGERRLCAAMLTHVFRPHTPATYPGPGGSHTGEPGAGTCSGAGTLLADGSGGTDPQPKRQRTAGAAGPERLQETAQQPQEPAGSQGSAENQGGVQGTVPQDTLDTGTGAASALDPRADPGLTLDAGADPPSALDSTLDLKDVLEVHEAKSFDYRVLHLLLRQLSKAPPDPLLMEFLRVDEMLVDIGDDLTDYEDDVEANSFNILRAYVHMYGRDAPIKLVERISFLEQQHTDLLHQLPAPLQQHYWSRHKQAVEEGGGEGSGRWVFPPLILDEPTWREGLKSGAGGDGSDSG